MDKRTKQFVYRFLWVATGVLLSTVLIGLISLVMIYNNLQGDWVVAMYFLLLLLAGVLLGTICGRIAWHKVYVEGVRGEKYTKEHEHRVREFESKFYSDLKDFDIDKAMKWTITVFLIFLMVLISACVAFTAVGFLKLHETGMVSVMQQLFGL